MLLAPSRPGLSSVAGQVKASGKVAQPTWPVNVRTSRRGKFREGSCAGVTSGTTDHTCTTATGLQLHCTSGGQGFVCVVFPVVGNVGRYAVRSVDVTPSRSLSKGVETTQL